MKRVALAFSVTLLWAAPASAAEVALRLHAIEEPWGAAVIRVVDLVGDKDYDFIAVTDTDGS
jgi:hypothetical protein